MTEPVNRTHLWIAEAKDLCACALIIALVALVIGSMTLSAGVVAIVMVDEIAWWLS